MKKLIFSLAILFCWSISWGQNNSLILAPNYIPNIGGVNNNPLPLPTFGPLNTNYDEGYKGQTPQAAKNIIVDNQSKIVFFIIDEHIYDRKGRLIDKFEFTINFGNLTKASGLISEIVVIPVPNDCNSYYLVSTGENPDAGVSFGKGYYARLKVIYDEEDNLLPESGLQLVSSDDCDAVAQSFENIIGSEYDADNNFHDERPLFAATPMNLFGNQYLFVANGLRIFRLNITEDDIIYSGYNVHLSSIFPYPANNIDIANLRREEMEIIPYQGGYRLALPMKRTQSAISYLSVVILDFDGNGNFITTSERLVDYELSQSTPGELLIKGIELSKDGSKLYVTHNRYNQYTSTLDMFDLNTTPIAKTIVSSFDGFQYSQIESTFDIKTPIDPNQCTMLIPYEGTIAAITDANSPSFVNNLDLNYSYLTINIPATTPFSPSSATDLVKLMQDQIDYMDYSFIEPDYFDEVSYQTVASGTWEDNSSGSNPLIFGIGNTAYINKELRILAGHTITIKNMNIHFSPGARVVIEHGVNGGQGGRLILDGTTLTVDDRCNEDVMWLGVEVWGNSTASQGSINNSTQGRLELRNYSVIEHAFIGALASQRNTITTEICPGVVETNVLPTNFNNSRHGGIIITRNSTFRGNQRGVFIPRYYSPSNANNLCAFRNTSFVWDDLLKIQTLPLIAHAQLTENNGVAFYGCDFNNLAPELFNELFSQGIGVSALNATFYVNSLCNVITQVGQPCPSTDPSRFQDLTIGIRSLYFLNPKSFNCENSTFTNCRYGIFTNTSRNIRVTTNLFEVRENSYQTAGLVMANSSGYKVEANHFYELDNIDYPNGDGNSYGIWVSNSGTEGNEIYRNTFRNLKIGGQTELTNAVAITDSNDPGSITDPALLNGLVWRCNQFYEEIYQHDLALMNKGSIDYFQGSDAYTSLTTPLQAKRMAANNRFSRGIEFGAGAPYLEFLPDHDLYSINSQAYRYVHITDMAHMKPDNYTLNNTIIVNQAGYNPIITDTTGACPSKLISRTKPILKLERKENKERIEELLAIIDKGDRALLLNYIQTWNDKNAVKNELKSGSPYLSDHVLLAYINGNPPVAMLKEIVLLNSPVSSIVMNAINEKNLPIGTRNQILAAQVGTSERTKLYSQISFHQNLDDELYYEIERSIILDTTSFFNLDSLEMFYTEEGDLHAMESLIETNILQGNNQKYLQTKSNLIALNAHPDFMHIVEIEKYIHDSYAQFEIMNSNSQLVQDLMNLRDDSDRLDVAAKASTILQMLTSVEDVPEFDRGANQAMIMNELENAIITGSSTLVVSIYPNPSTGQVYFDYPDHEEGVLSIQLMDLSGKIVYSYNSQSESNGERVDLSAVKKGMYMARISIDGVYVETQKLLLK
jgi:hypothetical protein